MTRATTRNVGTTLVALLLLAVACGEAGEGTTGGPSTDEPVSEQLTDGSNVGPSGEPSADDSASEAPVDGSDVGPGGYVWDGTIDEGIDGESILMGTSGPLSGPASAYSPITLGVATCFDYLNGEFGGVTMLDGVTRQLEVEVLDDGYSVELAVENVRRLHEEIGVFATVNIVGTPINTAITDITEGNEIPNILVATAATRWGRDIASGKYSQTIGWQPTYQTEGKVYGTFVANSYPGATVAILQQNDEFGDDYVSGFEQAIEGSDIEILNVQTYNSGDADVDQQMISLADSGADIFFNAATPKYAAQAMVGLRTTEWAPIQFLASVSASVDSVMIPTGEAGGIVEGVFTAKWAWDPADPKMQDDPYLKEYRDMFRKYSDPNILNLNDASTFYAWNSCVMQKQVYENSYPTRASLLATLGHLDEINPSVPGVYDSSISTNIDEGDGWPLEAMQISQYSDVEATFVDIFGAVIDLG